MDRETTTARPPYPRAQTSSTASSAFQSSSSLASMNVITSPTSSSRPGASSAPLPSPSSSKPPMGYFGSLGAPQAVASSAYEYQPDRAGAGRTAGETNAALQDFSLVAEAAKRAQMAVLMRDFGDVQL